MKLHAVRIVVVLATAVVLSASCDAGPTTQGTSGGSSQVAFALAHYGLNDVIGRTNLGGGPPGCPLRSPDGQHAPEPLLPGAPRR